MLTLTDARVTFETAVSRLTAKPDLVAKAKPLYAHFHKYESQYGELSQIRKLEQRMAELFPEDPQLSQFAARYSAEGFDPTQIRPTVSPAAQRRPKSTVMQSIEQVPSVQDSPRPIYNSSPRPPFVQITNSPKRPFPEDFESELNRPRKLARGESPLKGAAGRRLNEAKNARGTPQWQPNAPVSLLFSIFSQMLSGDVFAEANANQGAGTICRPSRHNIPFEYHPSSGPLHGYQVQPGGYGPASQSNPYSRLPKLEGIS